MMMMSSGGGRRTRLVLQVASVFLIILSASVTAQISCDNGIGNYTANSTYDANLNTVLNFLSTNVTDSGYIYATLGQNGDRANAFAMCRGDLQLQTCRSCIQNATADTRSNCPNQKAGINWYGGSCTVRYSNQSMPGIMVSSGGYTVWTLTNVSSPREFQTDLMALLESLRGQAANGGSLRKVAAGNRDGPDFLTIFALVQCTPDLSPDDCDRCLNDANAGLPPCCTPEAYVYRASCNLFYNTALFYNNTRLLELSRAPPPLGSSPAVTPPPLNRSGNNYTVRIVVIVVVAIVVCLILAVSIGVLLKKRERKREWQNRILQGHDGDDISTAESLQYDFAKIKVAVDGFSDSSKLGQSGFGAVYKGQLSDGQEVAVKRLSRGSQQGDMEFKNEVMLLARLQHRNLVRLFGFSLERTEKLLIYEFVQNASLDQFIFNSTRRSFLDWDRRYKIICGIARGILYLHEDSRLRIIHRDLKASNILLDTDMNPKIADFGMARLFDTDETRGSTSRIVGTYGYMAPEYAMHGHFSIKSDVFSFGVLVLEIISGQKNAYFRNGEKIEDLLSIAWKYWYDGTATSLIDPVLRGTSGVPRDILKCIHIGLLCVQENASDRPTMASVVLMLNSSSITLPVPSEPAFFDPDDSDSDVALLQQPHSREMESSRSTTLVKYIHSSKNDVSMTGLYPR